MHLILTLGSEGVPYHSPTVLHFFVLIPYIYIQYKYRCLLKKQNKSLEQRRGFCSSLLRTVMCDIVSELVSDAGESPTC